MPDLEKKVIVSADDFGRSPEANANILELLSLKKLQRISVMVNGKFSPEEINSLINSQIKIDLHLNFLSLLENNQTWRKKTGVLSRLLFFFRDYLTGKISAPGAAQTWMEQLEKFHTIFGRYPDGLNSHEHVHFFPPYFKIILTLAQKSKTTYLRFGKKDFIEATNIVSLIIFFLKKINRRRFLASGLASADFWVSLDWLEKDALQKIKNLPSGEIELIVHPERAAELEFLKTRRL
ncbi:MAG: hypothetical protein CO140_04565 [Candidatus Moranbacteria bacterium CG_4_9_14_3_um_filter_40_7]|nr:MAG: hypothetical protein COX31_03240 [Candidatus Moranbacteria bacterium CG23_combo_of_CG06-09_8_20_14_all_40_16]PIU81084.1 MAG: hypothetical protein COS71_00010 [Candidatus Moranbacteria bacterium CG06_land_8_20_14_3_00_40_12]PJA87396.1 MAG: hypothetical protein CO140_04565 [Candidatus Moranbacteria bacterium CG_4_9_14_3_um_filter_40_7]